MVLISVQDKDALKERTPEVLSFYGVTNPRGTFRPVWRDARKPCCIYSHESKLITDFPKDERFDVFELVEKMEGITRFPEQARRVAEIVGFGELAEDAPIALVRRENREVRPLFSAPCEAGFASSPVLSFAWAMGALFESDIALEYLHGRGFTDEKIYQNVLGFVREKSQLKNDDDSPMFTKHEPNKPKGYIVIPFPSDETFCRVEYCMLRAIPGEKPPESKELRPTGYKSPLYREWLISSRCKCLYVVEGLLDCLALESLINRPCVALGGIGMHKRFAQVINATLEELRPLKVVIAMDNDKAGMETAAKISKDLDALGIPHSSLSWPEGCKDACDVLKRGGE